MPTPSYLTTCVRCHTIIPFETYDATSAIVVHEMNMLPHQHVTPFTVPFPQMVLEAVVLIDEAPPEYSQTSGQRITYEFANMYHLCDHVVQYIPHSCTQFQCP